MMEMVKHLTPKDGQVLLLIGTMKGAFLFCSNGARKRWQVSGPHFPGHPIYALAYDGRQGRQRLWAGAQNPHFGSVLSASDDFGRSWTNPEIANIRFPTDTGMALKQIWQIALGGAAEPDTLYCGVEPAALFESHDAGESWSLVRGLFDHPHRPRWEPGGGGLCLHTVVPDPSDRNQMHIAISTGGVYRTRDHGASWQARNQGIRADYLPDKHPEFGQCVHKIVRHPSRPERLFLQNHGGLYRSEDGGDSWQDMANGVPSDFGFAMVMHPHEPETIYISPLESDTFRCAPEAKLRVFRTRNGGRSWEPLYRGLPQKNAFETVLRDAMAADALSPAGIYLGTRSGKLYGSSNEGNRWDLIIDGLPPVVCVKTAIIENSTRKKKSNKGGSAKRRSPSAGKRSSRAAKRA